jgi:hypothetical protein
MSMIGFSRFLSVPTPVCGPQDLRPEIVCALTVRNWWAFLLRDGLRDVCDSRHVRTFPLRPSTGTASLQSVSIAAE